MGKLYEHYVLNCTTLHTFKVTLTVPTVKNMGLAKQETC